MVPAFSHCSSVVEYTLFKGETLVRFQAVASFCDRLGIKTVLKSTAHPQSAEMIFALVSMLQKRPRINCQISLISSTHEGHTTNN